MEWCFSCTATGKTLRDQIFLARPECFFLSDVESESEGVRQHSLVFSVRSKRVTIGLPLLRLETRIVCSIKSCRLVRGKIGLAGQEAALGGMTNPVLDVPVQP